MVHEWFLAHHFFLVLPSFFQEAQTTRKMIALLLSVLLSLRLLSCRAYVLPASMPELIRIADEVQPRIDYTTNAFELLRMWKDHEKIGVNRTGYLCSTFIRWDTRSVKMLVENVIHTVGFCDWAVVIYNSGNFTYDGISDDLQSRLSVRRTKRGGGGASSTDKKNNGNTSASPTTNSVMLIQLPPKNQTEEYFTQICQDASTRLIHPDLGERLPRHLSYPCNQIIFPPNTPTNEALFSKMAMLVALLPYTHKYKYVWVLDSDMGLSSMDMNWFATLHQCAMPHVPFVSQPLLYERTQSYRYLQRSSWKNKGVLASSVGFIEIQVPLFDAPFFEWFVMAFIMPLLPSLHILGVDWGFDEMFCPIAQEFFLRTGHLRYGNDNFHREYKQHVCTAIISNLAVHHSNGGEIAKEIGTTVKLHLNFGLMKIVHRCFGELAQHGLQHRMDPLNFDTHYFRSNTLQANCSAVS